MHKCETALLKIAKKEVCIYTPFIVRAWKLTYSKLFCLFWHTCLITANKERLTNSDYEGFSFFAIISAKTQHKHWFIMTVLFHKGISLIDKRSFQVADFFFPPSFFTFFVVIAPDIYFHCSNTSLTDKIKCAVPTVSIEKGMLLKLSLQILHSSATVLSFITMIQLPATTLIWRPTFTPCSTLYKNTTEQRLVTVYVVQCSRLGQKERDTSIF